jgi:hypothetical protein
MTKFIAIFNFASGIVFALVGLLAVWRSLEFLSEAPHGQDGLVAWALMIIVVGICLVIGGLGYMRWGVSKLQGREMPEDS